MIQKPSSRETESFDLASALLSPAHMLGSALKASHKKQKPPISPLRGSSSSLPSSFVDKLHSGDDDNGNIEGNDDDDDDEVCWDDHAHVDDEHWNVSTDETTVYMEPAEECDEEGVAYKGSNEGQEEEEKAEVENDVTMRTTMPPSPVMSSAFVASPKIVPEAPSTMFQGGGLPAPASNLMTAMDAKAYTTSTSKGLVAPSSFDAKSLHGEVRQLIEAQVVLLLNHGSLEQLVGLHGIGPKRAQYILGELLHAHTCAELAHPFSCGHNCRFRAHYQWHLI